MTRETIISLRAKDNPYLTMHGLLVAENSLQWIIDEVYEETYKVKYPPRQRLLHMSKSGWIQYASLEREAQ